MCTYNGARYVEEQLQSLVAQTRLPDELVICDDRFDDNTVEVLRTFAARAAFPVDLGQLGVAVQRAVNSRRGCRSQMVARTNAAMRRAPSSFGCRQSRR
jgi:glycosyltransferase involved in cell wall biosynthesis